jgi:hypothetical protein
LATLSEIIAIDWLCAVRPETAENRDPNRLMSVSSARGVGAALLG